MLENYTFIYISVEWSERKRECYMSHEGQNELVKLMALQVQRKIIAHLSQLNSYVSVMIDECTDLDNQEQVTEFKYVPVWTFGVL